MYELIFQLDNFSQLRKNPVGLSHPLGAQLEQVDCPSVKGDPVLSLKSNIHGTHPLYYRAQCESLCNSLGNIPVACFLTFCILFWALQCVLLTTLSIVLKTWILLNHSASGFKVCSALIQTTVLD